MWPSTTKMATPTSSQDDRRRPFIVVRLVSGQRHVKLPRSDLPALCLGHKLRCTSVSLVVLTSPTLKSLSHRERNDREGRDRVSPPPPEGCVENQSRERGQ